MRSPLPQPSLILCLALLAVPLGVATAGCSAHSETVEPPQVGEPRIGDPRPPALREGDLRQLPRTEPWRPGEPVREVGDLRQTGYPDAVVRLSGEVLEILDAAGRPLAAPRPVRELWSGPQGPCAGEGFPGAALAHDAESRRWVVSRLVAAASGSGSVVCIAASRMPDPATAGWHLYTFPLPLKPAPMSLRLTSKQLLITVAAGPEAAEIRLDCTALFAGDALTPELRGGSGSPN